MITPVTAPIHKHPSAVVGHHCVLGYPKEERIMAWQTDPDSTEPGGPVVIGANCMVFMLYEGVRVDDRCVIEDRVRIGYDSSIGSASRLMYGAYLCDRVTIGANSRIAGFVCDGSSIGDSCTVMGQLVHEYTQPHRDWWAVDEASPVIEHDTIVGYGAVVVGGVRIGPNSYVAAGATVTRDVPPHNVVTGLNKHTPVERWQGRRLRGLLRHWATRAATAPHR